MTSEQERCLDGNVYLRSKRVYCLTVTRRHFTLIIGYELYSLQGRIQDFKLGGTDLKKLCRAEGGTKIFGAFRVKNHDFMPKNLIFSNFRGNACPPGSPPALLKTPL
jgi:hypothetical protein